MALRQASLFAGCRRAPEDLTCGPCLGHGPVVGERRQACAGTKYMLTQGALVNEAAVIGAHLCQVRCSVQK